MKKVYWLVFLLCLVWFYQGIFLGMGYNYLINITNKSKSILYYSIYVRLISHRSSSLKGDIKGKILNALTEFHDILEDCGWLIVEFLSSVLPIIGIFVILLTKLGWLTLLFIILLVLLFVTQYLYSEYNSRQM